MSTTEVQVGPGPKTEEQRERVQAEIRRRAIDLLTYCTDNRAQCIIAVKPEWHSQVLNLMTGEAFTFSAMVNYVQAKILRLIQEEENEENVDRTLRASRSCEALSPEDLEAFQKRLLGLVEGAEQ